MDEQVAEQVGETVERLQRGAVCPPSPKLQQLNLNCSNNKIPQKRTKKEESRRKQPVCFVYTLI